MAHRPVSGGFTLIEVLVGTCVAVIVAAITLTALTAAGLLARRVVAASQCEDRAWFALAAIARDFEAAGPWLTCTEARDCPSLQLPSHYRAPVFMAGDIAWLLQDGLRRCDGRCTTIIAAVDSLEVVADVPGAGGLVRRERFLQRHGATARALEFTLTMKDRRRFTRVVSRHGSTP